MKKLDYIYIRAWDRMMLSSPGWTEHQLAQARRENAPKDAIYYEPTQKRWRRFSEVTNDVTKLTIERMVVSLKAE